MKLIFIIGSGHSGSTILDKAIGSHPKAFSLGEISKFSSTVDSQGLCSCGSKITECKIWSQQIEKLVNKTSAKETESTLLFPTRIDSLKSPIILNITEFIAQLLGFNFFFNKYNKRCIKNSIKIQRGINTLGYTHLIDSTKSLRRAVMIANDVGSKNCFFIHLIRDGRAVMNSYNKQDYLLTDPVTDEKKVYSRKPSDPKKIFRNWKYANLFIHLYLKIKYNKQSITVKYEDFCNNPDIELERIWKRAGLSFFDTQNYLDYTSHIIGGNSSRFNAKEIHPPSFGWKKNLSAKYKKLFLTEAKYLLRLFGYE